ncbi:DNA repair protein RecO [Candidatus Dojkabacteria bacterium]|uniref:DNA repair protein RecO n=1 Tax=Candidatus Dojkabacteria bacterium TaxID=2099670 RepID=A0A955I6H5_9BACT|nr:DNA repair protein RecO [Candidatus Dojkabacteria bacterium]
MKTKSEYGFIIKIKQFPEADKLVVFLTKKHGNVETVAKGVGKSSSKRVSSIDLLNHTRFTYYETKSIDLLKEVQVLNDYQDIKQDKNIVNHLLYILEIIEKLNSTNDDEIKAYTLMYDLLELTSLNKSKFPQLLTSFELKLLDLAGFTPNIVDYVKSGEPILEKQTRILSFGNELGYNLTKSDKTGKVISDRVLKIQKYYLENSLSDCLRLKVDGETHKMISYINRYWIENTIEKRLKSSTLIN